MTQPSAAGPAPSPVRPDYDGAWVGGLVPALLGSRPPGWLPEPAAMARSTVLLVLDGLGWNMLQRHREILPHLARMTGGPITATAPSTTAAGLTSIATGLTPAQHGLVGYRMRVDGQVLNVLRWRTPGERGKPPDPVRVQPAPPFLGRRIPVVTRAEFRDSGFTAAHLRGGEFFGWHTTSVLVEQVRRLTDGGQRFVYAYYDGVDKVAHAHGMDDGFLAVELAETDRLVGLLLDRLGGDCALVVTADHGQVASQERRWLPFGPLDELVSAAAGEGRFRSLHATAGASEDLRAAATERFGDVAWVFSRDELFDDGWLGHGATAEVRCRLGDVVLAAHAPVSFLDPAMTCEKRLRSQHGSLTADEMLVPLVAAYGRA